ncbi:MAG: CPBP family intramembrane metalloprotease, partial [Eubacteriales bacterium]|nr:CPBP family intramembrane metalloprotease [Eubacteriales bacterium]
MACLGITAAAVEEPLFRGILQRGLAARLRKWPALVLTALLFALCHFQHQGLPTLFVVGLCLGWLTWQTGSLWPSIAMHLSYNMTAVAMQYAMARLSQLISDLPLQGVIDTAQDMTPLMMLASGASWLVIGLPFIGIVALLLWAVKKTTPDGAAWTPTPWAPRAKGVHALSWVLIGLTVAGGMLIIILLDFGFFNWVMERFHALQ